VSRFYLRPDANRANILANVIRFLQSLPDGRGWEIIVRPLAKARSDRQNNALFGVAYPALSKQTGNDVNALHYFFCGEFFGWVELWPGSEHRRPFRTTTRDEHGKRDVISWDWFSDFYGYIQQRGAEQGWFVPDPDPYRSAD